MIQAIQRGSTLVKRILKRTGVDRSIYLCVFVLTIFGIVMIGSASVGQTATKGPTYATMNMIKQTFFVLTGAVFMVFFARCFQKKWIDSTPTWILYGLGLAAMLVCLAFGETKGSYAWIRVGSFSIQPAEFMKVIMILFLSYHFGEIEEECRIPKYISKKEKEELQLRKFWYCVIRSILASFLVFIVGGFVQKDLGSALIIAFIVMMMFFITPRPYYKKFKKLFIILLGVLCILVVLLGAVFLKSHQLGRIFTWLDPLGDVLGSGWQLTNSLIAFSTAGLFGKGFGNSQQKYGFIPESHNDFISAIIFEELGIIGLALFLVPYCIIIYKMFHYGMKMKDTKSQLILYGIGIYFFTHLIVNVGGVSGFIPMTGVPLLMVSSGGSSTWASMMSIGIAQSIIARYNRDLLKEQM